MKNTFLSSLVPFAVLAGCLVIMVVPVVQHERDSSAQRSCRSSLKQLGLALQMYAADFSNACPPVSGTTEAGFGWAASLAPFVRDKQIFQCTRAPWPRESVEPRAVGYTDYWMNRRMGSLRLATVVQPASTILLGEGNDGTDATDARYALNALPASWRKEEDNPAHRHLHLGGANYVFVDGHVKWLRASNVQDGTKLVDGMPHFAIK
jgi:prepilin-type processing-associated H-X9-DG protein